MTSGGLRREVVQVGDIAGVGHALIDGLRAHSDWSVTPVELEPPTVGGRLHKALELPTRGIQAHRLVRAAVANGRADVVHVHWARYAPFIGRIGRPTLYHAHGSDVRGRSGSLSGRLVRASLSRASMVLVSTPDLLDDVNPGARYLPNPVDTKMFVPAEVASSAGERRTVLLFSQLIDVKGAATLLAAARRLLAIAPETRIVAFRGGTYDSEAAEAGVEMLPRRSRADLAHILARADVVVGQLLLGSLGLSELEAMSCARPVVAFVRPGLYPSDLPVVSAATADEVADACAALLSDRQGADTLGVRARTHVVQHHDTAVVVRQLVSIYEEIM